MHAIPVKLDFVEPLISFRRRVDELRQFRPDLRQRGGDPAMG